MKWYLLKFTLGKSKFRTAFFDFVDGQEGYKLGKDCFVVRCFEKELIEVLDKGEWKFLGSKNKRDMIFVVSLPKVSMRVCAAKAAYENWRCENPRKNRSIQVSHCV